jgi:hypothetical protein
MDGRRDKPQTCGMPVTPRKRTSSSYPASSKQAKQDKHPHFTRSRVVACGRLMRAQLNGLAETKISAVIGGEWWGWSSFWGRAYYSSMTVESCCVTPLGGDDRCPIEPPATFGERGSNELQEKRRSRYRSVDMRWSLCKEQ